MTSKLFKTLTIAGLTALSTLQLNAQQADTTQLDNNHPQTDSLEFVIAKQHNTIEQLKEQQSFYKEKYDTCERQRDSLYKELEAQPDTIETVVHKIPPGLQAKNERLQEETKNMREEIDDYQSLELRLQDTITSLRFNVKQYKQELSLLEKNADEQEWLATIDSLYTKIDNLTTLTYQAIELGQQTDSTNVYVVDSLQQELDFKTAQVDALQDQKKENKEYQATIAQLEQHINKLEKAKTTGPSQQVVDSLYTVTDQLEQRINELEATQLSVQPSTSQQQRQEQQEPVGQTKSEAQQTQQSQETKDELPAVTQDSQGQQLFYEQANNLRELVASYNDTVTQRAFQIADLAKRSRNVAHDTPIKQQGLHLKQTAKQYQQNEQTYVDQLITALEQDNSSSQHWEKDATYLQQFAKAYQKEKQEAVTVLEEVRTIAQPKTTTPQASKQKLEALTSHVIEYFTQQNDVQSLYQNTQKLQK